MKETVVRSIAALRQNSEVAYVSSVDKDGYPVIRAMLALEHERFRTQYFSTNTSSSKVAAFRANPKASVYYCDPEDYRGVLFVGDVEVCTDQETKDFLWREGFERYYPKGVTDPDYCVLKLTATRGAYYHGLDSTGFSMDELEEAIAEPASSGRDG